MYGVFTVQKANSKLQDMEFSSFFHFYEHQVGGGGVIKSVNSALTSSVAWNSHQRNGVVDLWVGEQVSPHGLLLNLPDKHLPDLVCFVAQVPDLLEKNPYLLYTAARLESVSEDECFSENIKINSRLFCRGKKTKFDTIFITSWISIRLDFLGNTF